MKTLYIVRHAKSSWANPLQEDHERPLNSRGKRDAPYMAEVLHDREPVPELLVSSVAKRARKTANYFRKEFGIDKSQLLIEDRLYHASPDMILQVIRDLSDDSDIVALFGHNPGITDFVNECTTDYIDNVPTTGIAKVQTELEHWPQIDVSDLDLKAFYYPKMIGI